jgi:hypothetical protein
VTHLIVFDKGVSNVDTSGFQESENHATAKDELVDLREKEIKWCRVISIGEE